MDLDPILVRMTTGLVAFATLFLSGGTAFADPSDPGTGAAGSKKNKKPLFDYRQVQLKNGLTVLTMEDFSCPIVAVQVWYHVGSKDEDPQRQGFAHMFEHMMFRGTEKLGPTDHFGYIRRVGGTTNGFTSFDRTVYIEKLPASQLELALWLEAERMAFLKIDQKAFDTERKVVEEERRIKLNEPYGTLIENLLPEIFKQHPYRWAPIGKIPHLRAASVEELQDFFATYYVPNNATLVIVGAVKHAEAQALAKKYFEWIPRAADPPRVTIREPMPTGRRQVTIKEASAPAPGVGVVYRTVPSRHKDAVALDVLSEILGGGNSSRLYRELVADRQLAVAAVAESWTLEQDGIVGAAAVLPPVGGKPDLVLKAIEKQIGRLRTEPVSDRELVKAKNQMLRGIVTQCLHVESKANLLGTAAIDMGDVSRVNRELDEIRAVTAADVLRVAREYLAPERALEVKVERNLLGTVLGVKEKEEAPVKPAAKPRKTTPTPSEAVRCSRTQCKDLPKTPPIAKVTPIRLTPKFTEEKLPNGLKVLVVPNGRVPFVTVQLGILAGGWTEAKPGTASMAMKMLVKGTAKHTEGQLADELETYAIDLDGNGDMDSGSVSASCLSEHLPRAMDLLGEVVLTPTFPAAEFTKLRRQVLTSLMVSSAEPEYIADREFRRKLYGNHPYARSATGEIEDVQALKVGDLKQWWTTYARPDMAVLIIAGDVTAKDALALARKTFGEWQAKGPKPDLKLPELTPPDQTRIYLVDMPGNTQSQIRMGQFGLTRQDPDYYYSRVVSSYFGWGFDSRLNKSIRVEKGLTYGVWGSFMAQRFAGNFEVGTFSKTESTANAVRAVLDEIKRLKAEGPTMDELECTRSYILGSFVGERETPQQIANDLWLIESHGLKSDYLECLLNAIAQTKKEHCEGVVRKVIDPDKQLVVVVGDAAKLKPELEKIAPVIVISTPPESKAKASASRPAGKPQP